MRGGRERKVRTRAPTAGASVSTELRVRIKKQIVAGNWEDGNARQRAECATLFLLSCDHQHDLCLRGPQSTRGLKGWMLHSWYICGCLV